MFPFPNFTQIMDTLKQLPTTWWGKLLPGRSPGLPIPDVVRKDAARLEMTEKILTRIEAGGKKIYFLPLVDSYTEETQKMRDAYRVMLREPAVKAALLTKILGVAHLDLKVTPASDRPLDRLASDIRPSDCGPIHPPYSIQIDFT
jgi:hypothetical protein